MDFSLSDDLLALRDAVRRFCDTEYPAVSRGNAESREQAAQRHAALADLGLMGLGLPADFGGSGLGAEAAMLAAQELGAALAGPQFLASGVLVGPLLAEAATPAQAARWLPALADGRLAAALALHEDGARHPLDRVATRATPAPGDGAVWRLDGRKTLVLGGDDAALLLVAARTAGAETDADGLTLFAIDADQPGVQRQAMPLLDGRRAARLVLDGVTVSDDRRVGPLHGARPLLDTALARAQAALAAESAGALDALLAQCVEHLKTRRQFGAPLAKFQALQHAVAEMAMAVEQLKSMACVAAMAVDGAEPAERRRLVAAASALTAQLGRRHGLAAIQLHGAMGMTDECRVGHFAKRLITNGLLFGDAAHHLQQFAPPTGAPTDIHPVHHEGDTA